MHILLILLFRPATISYCNFKNLLFYVNMAKLFCIIMSSNKVEGRWVQTPGKQLAWKLEKHFFFFKSMFVKALLFFTSADVVSFLSGRKLAQVEITFDCTLGWPWFAWAAQEFSVQRMGACCGITKLNSTHINPAPASHAEPKADIGLSV